MSEPCLQPFHLAIPVDSLADARAFYGGLLGCAEGRSSELWVDFDFFGHQLLVHSVSMSQLQTHVGGDDAPGIHD